MYKKLHQLPNGDWIDLRYVVSIVYGEPTGPLWQGGETIPPRLIIHMYGPLSELPHREMCNSTLIVKFSSELEAQKYRDELALLVNEYNPTYIPTQPGAPP